MPIAYNLYYEIEGEGRPIIFIHPPHMGHAVFTYQKQLSTHFQVIVYDMRGQGNSGMPSAEPISVSLMAEDLYHLTEKLRISSAILCGYSNGGSIALEFALKYPEKTEAIVLSGGFSEVSTFILRRQFKLGIGLTTIGAKRFLSKILAKSHRVTKDDEQRMFEHMMKSNVKVTKALYQTGLRYNCTKELNRLSDKPMYLVYGAKSHHMHPYIDIFRSYVPDAKPIYISKSLHQVPTKFHNEFNQIIKTHLL